MSMEGRSGVINMTTDSTVLFTMIADSMVLTSLSYSSCQPLQFPLVPKEPKPPFKVSSTLTLFLIYPGFHLCVPVAKYLSQQLHADEMMFCLSGSPIKL